MTRVIASFHFKIGTFPGAGADEFDEPASPADTGHRQRRGGESGDTPARDGGGRLTKVRSFRLAAPAAESDAHCARGFGGELEAAGDRHGKSGGLPHDQTEPSVPEALFQASEHGLVITGLQVDDLIGSQPCLGQGRRIEVWAVQAPEYRPFHAGGDAGDKAGGRRSIDRAVASACDLMQGAMGQAGARQTGVDFW